VVGLVYENLHQSPTRPAGSAVPPNSFFTNHLHGGSCNSLISLDALAKTSMHGPGGARPPRHVGPEPTSLRDRSRPPLFCPLLSSKTQKGFSFVASDVLRSVVAQEGAIYRVVAFLPLPCRQTRTRCRASLYLRKLASHDQHNWRWHPTSLGLSM